MNELIERFKSESPVFFKKLKKYALSIGGSSAAVLIVNASMGLNLSQTLVTVLGYVVAACAAIAGTSQLTKQ